MVIVANAARPPMFSASWNWPEGRFGMGGGGGGGGFGGKFDENPSV